MFLNKKKTCDVIKPGVTSNKCTVRRLALHLIVIVAHVVLGAGQALADLADRII